MNFFLILTFLFAIGSIFGWGIEVIYRRFVSQKHWVNPGFLTGPALPLYGMSLSILYLLAGVENDISIDRIWVRKLLLFIVMAIAITCLEFLVGELTLRVAKIRLWDYTKCFGNIRGMICPQYSFYWMLMSAIYYFFIHPHILNALNWLAQNLAFSFAIGFFYGIFVIDLAYSAQIIIKIRQFATDREIIVRLEELREDIYHNLEQRKKHHFLLSLHTGRPLSETLEFYREKHFGTDKIKKKIQQHIKH